MTTATTPKFEYAKEANGLDLKVTIEPGLGYLIPDKLTDAAWICTHKDCGVTHLLFPGYGARNWGRLGKPSTFKCYGYDRCAFHYGTIMPQRMFVNQIATASPEEVVRKFKSENERQEKEHAREQQRKNGPARSLEEVKTRLNGPTRICPGCGVPLSSCKYLCEDNDSLETDRDRTCYGQFHERGADATDPGAIWAWLQTKLSPEAAEKKRKLQEFVDDLAKDPASCKRLRAALKDVV